MTPDRQWGVLVGARRALAICWGEGLFAPAAQRSGWLLWERMVVGHVLSGGSVHLRMSFVTAVWPSRWVERLFRAP